MSRFKPYPFMLHLIKIRDPLAFVIKLLAATISFKLNNGCLPRNYFFAVPIAGSRDLPGSGSFS